MASSNPHKLIERNKNDEVAPSSTHNHNHQHDHNHDRKHQRSDMQTDGSGAEDGGGTGSPVNSADTTNTDNPVSPENVHLNNRSATNSDIIDVFKAYSLCTVGLSPVEIGDILNDIATTKKTFPYLQEVIQSNRYPYTIMLLASKIGMYIPPRRRWGIEAYRFYIDNIGYYEATFERGNQKVPNVYEIYMSNDRVGLLMRFRDDEILRVGYRFKRNYLNRYEMITNFIRDNVCIYGEFKLENNSRRSYLSKAKVITYIGSGEKITYSTNELHRLFDMSRKIVWTDSQKTHRFHNYSLLHLRQQILEKFDQWRHRDGCCLFNGPSELYKILANLEVILASEVRNDTGAYLGTPQLPY